MNDLAQRTVTQWTKLKQLYNWTIIEDENLFLEALINENLHTSLDNTQLKARIISRYSQALFTCFCSQWEPCSIAEQGQAKRATTELMEIIKRIIYKHAPSEYSEEFQQIIIQRLITKRHEINQPSALIAWIMWQVRDILSRKTNKAKTVRNKLGQRVYEFTDQDITGSNACEQHMLATGITDLIKQLLPERQFNILYHTVIMALPPREVADVLNMPISQVRVEKSRALKRLRTHPALLDWLGETPHET